MSEQRYNRPSTSHTALAECDIVHSRQSLLVGDEAMRKLINGHVYVGGLGGLGVEILKNLILLCVGELTVEDDEYASEDDLKVNFVINKDDVFDKRNRAEICCEKFKQLNKNIKINISKEKVNLENDLGFLRKFDCVVLTGKILPLSIRVNQFCRDQSPSIPFISTDVRGVCGWCFVDFAKDIVVTDIEETECKIRGYILKVHPGVVTIWNNKYHGLENGDRVRLRSVDGRDRSLDKTSFQVKSLSTHVFSTDVSLGDFEGEVFVCPIRTSRPVKYESLADQLYNPAIVSMNNGNSKLTHLAILAFYAFLGKFNRVPQGASDIDLILKSVDELNKQHFNDLVRVDYLLLEKLFFTWNKSVQPFCSLFGGLAAQEVLKCLTGKYTPLQQWYNFECSCLVDKMLESASSLEEVVSTKLQDLNLLLVGCGAIGCEFLKNCALLGIGKNKGKLNLVDHDRVELANFHNQYLYRSQHLGQHKSIVAADAVKMINPDLNITSFPLSVCPETEDTFTDEFYDKIDVIITAIDNTEGRKYLDSQCIKYTRPMLDSGMEGNKGHVQIIIPHESEHYSKHRDTLDEEYPNCTLKSFPATIEHAVKWARNKFDSLFDLKPNKFNKFFKNHPDLNETINSFSTQRYPFRALKKALRERLRNPEDCVCRARILFENYFNRKASQLLHNFTQDSKAEDGSKFWQFPKRIPSPVLFLPGNKLHVDFVKSCAKLLAITYNIKEHIPENITSILLSQRIPEFQPKNKSVETDVQSSAFDDLSDREECVKRIKSVMGADGRVKDDELMYPLKFGKDDPLHIDFIEAASNLRATLYGIETEGIFEIRKLASNIIPAISTTSSVVASLLTIELLKLVIGVTSTGQRNYFFNLALPMLISSEPGPATRMYLNDRVSYTIWDSWEIRGNQKFTLLEFLDRLTTITGGLKVSLVTDGKNVVYIPYLPGHAKKLKLEMTELINGGGGKKFMDLSVAFDGDKGEDLEGPRIRYYLS